MSTSRIMQIISDLKLAASERGYARRSDLRRASDINHIKKHANTFIEFCEQYQIKTAHTRRMKKQDHRAQVISIIKNLHCLTGKTPSIREVKEKLRLLGRSSIKMRFNDLIIQAGLATNRTTTITEQSILNKLTQFIEHHGFIPYAHNLKASIDVAPNSTLFKRHGGYLQFLINVGLIDELQLSHGALTPIRTYGNDGFFYDSRIEAAFANFLLNHKIDYIPHICVGVFHHPTNQLVIDFLVKYHGQLAIEIDGLGKLRRNVVNMEEKKRRSELRNWRWIIIPRDKVRHLCQKQDMEYWERLVS